MLRFFENVFKMLEQYSLKISKSTAFINRIVIAVENSETNFFGQFALL